MNKPLLIALAALLLFGGGYVKGSYDKAQKWALSEAKRIQLETQAALKASEDARKKEHEYSQAIAKIDKEGLDKIKELQNEKNTIIAGLKRDNVRLSITVKNTNSRACTESPTASMDNGEVRAELSDEAFKFLAGEAERADKIAVTLDACQRIIEAQ